MELQASAAARSDVGQSRSTNEDFFALRPEIGLYLVADGMGGHGNGEVASKLAALSVCKTMQERTKGGRHPKGNRAGLEVGLKEALEIANDEVFRAVEKDARLSGMGATIVAMLRVGEDAIVAHAGDSRAYRFRAGRLEQLTRDHTWVGQQVAAGELSEDEARNHPFRNVVTRALGGETQLVVDVQSHPIRRGDLFVLCTDGLNGAIEDEELAEIIDQESSLDSRCAALIDAANDAGGPDNVTVVLVSFDDPDQAL